MVMETKTQLRSDSWRVDDDTLTAVVDMTREFFKCEVEEDFDPEDPENPWQVVIVTAQGEPQELVELQKEWHRRVEPISLHAANSLRLWIRVQ
jgi:predicted transposase YdaD